MIVTDKNISKYDFIQEYLKLAVPKFQKDLKLSQWEIRWKIEKVEGSAESSCKVNSTYYTLDVSFDPTKIRNEAHLKETLIHELLHAVVGQYEVTSTSIMDQVSPLFSRSMQFLLDTELERTVTHLERIITPLIDNPLENSPNHWT